MVARFPEVWIPRWDLGHFHVPKTFDCLFRKRYVPLCGFHYARPRRDVKRDVTEGAIPQSPGELTAENAQREKRSPRKHKGRKQPRPVAPRRLRALVVDGIRDPKAAMRNADSRGIFAHISREARGREERGGWPVGVERERKTGQRPCACYAIFCIAFTSSLPESGGGSVLPSRL